MTSREWMLIAGVLYFASLFPKSYWVRQTLLCTGLGINLAVLTVWGWNQ